jgi:hypothetical protein
MKSEQEVFDTVRSVGQEIAGAAASQEIVETLPLFLAATPE